MVVAGAEYEVNISLNTKTIEGQLNTLEKRINKMRRSINGPLSALQRQAALEDRIKASRVISFRLGQQLNQLEEKGVNVAKARKQITAATTNLDKKQIETARARNKIVGEFIKLETKNLDLKQKAKKVADETTKEEVINKRMQAESIDAMQRARDAQSRFRAQINQLEAKGVNVRKQRNQLAKLSTAQAKGEFGTFKQISAILKNSIRNEQSKLSIQKQQTSELEKQARINNKFLSGAPMRFPSGGTVKSTGAVGPFLPPTFGPGFGPSSFLTEKPFKHQGRQLADDIDARLKAQEKSARLANRINELEVKGVNVAKHRKQLGRIRTAQADGLFGLAEREVRVLRKSLELEQSKLRILKDQSKFLTGGPMRFPSGRRVKSPFDVGPARALTEAAPSSFIGEKQLQDIEIFERKQQRAALNAHFRQLGFIQKETKAKIAANDRALKKEQKAIEDFDKKFNQTIERREKAGMRLMNLAGKAGGLAARTARLIDASNLRQANASALPSSEMLAKRAKKSGQELVRIKTDEARLQERIARAYERSAIRSGEILDNSRQLLLPEGRPTRPITSADAFGPQLPSRTSAPLTGMFGGRRAGDPGAVQFGGMGGRAGDIALGAGFPLLFGGGPGAVLGGALGGATGGGLAAQIALSAIGQQIDTLFARIAGVGSAFNELSFNLDTVATSTGIANTETQEHLEEIEQYGSSAEAAQLATELLASRVGGPGRDALKKFGEDAVTLGNNLNIIFTQVLAAISKIAGPLIEKLSQMAGNTAARGAFDRATGLTGVEAAVQKFTTTKGRVTVQDAKNLRRDLKAAGFTGELPLATTRSAQKFAEDFALEAGKKLLKAPEIKIQEIAASLQTPEEKSAAEKAANLIAASRRRIQNLEAEEQKTREISAIRGRIAAAEEAGDKQLVERLRGEEKAAEIIRKKARLLSRIPKDLDEQQRLAEELAISDTIRAEQLANQEATQRRIAKVIRDEQIEAIKQQEQLYKQLGDTVKDGLVDSIKAAIDDTRTLGEALSSMLRRLGDQFLQLAANMAFYGNAQGTLRNAQGQRTGGGIFGSLISALLPIPGASAATSGLSLGTMPDVGNIFNVPSLKTSGISFFANGGNPPVGRPSIVGERGPELFVPRTAGTIIPNHAMGSANVTVNVDASGSSVQGDGPSAQQLGKAIGAAVQAELIKQKRPGGLLTR